MGAPVLFAQSRSLGLRLNLPSQKSRTACGRPARRISSTAERRKAIPFTLSSASQLEHDERGEKLRMVMFGKPGAGKGTLSERLMKKFDIVSISTGDLLRQHISQKTEIGRQAEVIVAKGDLLPDELMLQVLSSRLDGLKDKHWILDGFPRTVGQGKLLDAHLRSLRMPLTLLVTLSVPVPVLRARISGRFVHPASGRVYNTHFNPPRVPGKDDVTGEQLIQRPDDAPEVYERRLTAYEAQTAPLLGYYRGSGSMGGEREGRMRTLALAGETSDEMWPLLERGVREMFSSVRVCDEAKEKTRDAVNVLSAAKEREKEDKTTGQASLTSVA